MFCWNAGGLSTGVYAELLRCLETSTDIAVAIIQETHWTTSGEWCSGGWQIVHSASERKRQDGVMVAVSRDLLSHSEVCWQEVIPGRLLRVRAEIKKQCWEILGVYQHAMTNRTAEETTKIFSQRRQVWRALDRTTSGMPFSSSLGRPLQTGAAKGRDSDRPA